MGGTCVALGLIDKRVGMYRTAELWVGDLVSYFPFLMCGNLEIIVWVLWLISFFFLFELMDRGGWLVRVVGYVGIDGLELRYVYREEMEGWVYETIYLSLFELILRSNRDVYEKTSMYTDYMSAQPNLSTIYPLPLYKPASIPPSFNIAFHPPNTL